MTPMLLCGLMFLVSFVLLICASKVIYGEVTVGTVLFVLCASAVPFFNIIMSGFMWLIIADRQMYLRNVFSMRIW